MILKKSLSNASFKQQAMSAVNILDSIRAFQVLMEIGIARGKIQPSTHPTETAALTAAYMAGYNEALSDLYDLGNFAEKTISKPNSTAVITELHRIGEITDDEFKRYQHGTGSDQ